MLNQKYNNVKNDTRWENMCKEGLNTKKQKVDKIN